MTHLLHAPIATSRTLQHGQPVAYLQMHQVAGMHLVQLWCCTLCLGDVSAAWLFRSVIFPEYSVLEMMKILAARLAEMSLFHPFLLHEIAIKVGLVPPASSRAFPKHDHMYLAVLG